MIIQLSKYRANFPVVEGVYLREKNKKTVGEIISIAAVATGIPVIVAAYYMGEIVGFTDEVKERIDSLMKFYNYSEVLE